MTTILTIGASILVLFVVYVIANFGILSSLSDSFYKIKNNWLFTVVMWAFAVCILVLSARMATSILLPIACMGIMAVGAAPRFKDRREKVIHFTGAAIGIGFGMASLWFDFGLWWLVLIAVGLFVAIKFGHANNALWWGEMVALMAIVAGLIIGVINSGITL